MDSEEYSQRPSKGRRGDGEKICRRVWTKIEEEALLDALQELCHTGWKQDTGLFRPGYLNELERLMIRKIPGTDLRVVPHIESKTKVWKAKYMSIAGALSGTSGTSGIGWNDSSKTLDCPDDNTWDMLVKRDPNLKGARHKPCPYYPAWCNIFAKDRATGEMAEGPTDAVDAMEQEDIPAEFAGSQSVTQILNEKNVTKQGGRKRFRGNDIMATELGNMSRAISKFCEDSKDKMQVLCTRIGYQYDESEARKKIFGEIDKLDNLGMSDKLKASTVLVNDTGKMDLFFSLPNECKAEWVTLLLRGEL